MGSYWREVFDFSDRAQTPARLRAAVQVCGLLGLVAVTAMLAVGLISGWSSAFVIVLAGVGLFGLAQSARSYYELRRARRRRRALGRVGDNQRRETPETG